MKPFIPQTLPIQTINWKELIKDLGPANRALAQFNGALLGLRNPDLLLSPLTTNEAVLSSRIEGTQATLDEVLKFEAGEAPEREERVLDIQEILNYQNALRRAEDELVTRPFNLNLLLELHSILLDSVRGRDKARGRLRTEQNWIGRPGSTLKNAEFVPPEPLSIRHHLSSWEKYYHHDSPDALVQLAVVHAQFEIIHPFVDGNGRLGRILIPLFLYEKQILSKPVFYLSSYFEEHRDEYIEKLRAIGRQRGSWNEWIQFFLHAITEQAQINLHTAQQIMKLYERLKGDVIKLTNSKFGQLILDAFFERPILQPSFLEQRSGMPSKQMIMHIIRKLTESSLISVIREPSGRRSQILVLNELLQIVNGNARRKSTQKRLRAKR